MGYRSASFHTGRRCEVCDTTIVVRFGENAWSFNQRKTCGSGQCSLITRRRKVAARRIVNDEDINHGTFEGWELCRRLVLGPCVECAQACRDHLEAELKRKQAS